MSAAALATPVTLGDLVRAGIGTLHGDESVVIGGVRHDSRAVEPGDLFVAVSGSRVDGARFAQGAVDRGASAVLSDRLLDVDVPQVVVDDARRGLGRAASLVYRHPTDSLEVVGVTGTNGKTTTVWLIEAMIGALGGRPAMIGTVLFRGPGFSRPATHTTPEADDIARFARAAVDAGATHLVMEVSSHGLALRRIDALRFSVAAFTNLTRDHLDFHGDFVAYGEAKARLFLELGAGTAVVNVDDAFGAALAAKIGGPCLRVSCRGEQSAEIRVVECSFARGGTRARVATPGGEVVVETPLLGAHNIENVLVALGCGVALGYDPARVAGTFAAAAGAPGRMERIHDPRDVAVLVDYAHTPDALERVLVALRPTTPGRLIVVFGCGGDRDSGKRPRMGEAAGRGADLCIVTSDNPRSEAPGRIIEAIVPAVVRAGKEPLALSQLAAASSGFVSIEDRAHAIAAALGAARAGDTVLIAGKGHEDYQVVGATRRHFDDREVARAQIDRLRERG